MLLVWCMGSSVRADLLTLSDGKTLEGIVAQETDTTLNVRVAWQGYVTLNRASVVSIVPSGEAGHQRLLERWKEEFEGDRTRQTERQAFESAQRERGLVKHQGEWITTEELAFHQAQLQLKAAEQLRKDLKQEIQQLKERLGVLEAENAKLQGEVRRRKLWWFTRPRVIIQQSDETP